MDTPSQLSDEDTKVKLSFPVFDSDPAVARLQRMAHDYGMVGSAAAQFVLQGLQLEADRRERDEERRERNEERKLEARKSEIELQKLQLQLQAEQARLQHLSILGIRGK
jgi:hypothetical protein